MNNNSNMDMSNLLNQVNNMIKNNQIPKEVQEMMNNLNLGGDSSKSGSSECLSNDSSNKIPEIDISTMLKIKKMMESMGSNKDDPRANLLRSLKPYLKDTRKSQIEQYIQMFNMEKAIEMFNSLGGDVNK